MKSGLGEAEIVIGAVKSRKGGMSDDMFAAYTALYTTLKALSIVRAPFTPVCSDFMYRNLWGEKESVHLEDYPQAAKSLIDKKLEEEMNIAIRIAEAGRRARQIANIKLRQPLAKMSIVAGEKYHPVIEKFMDVLKEEINVKDIEIMASAGAMVQVEIKPNYKVLGPKLKGDMKKVLKTLQEMPIQDIVNALKGGGIEIEGYNLTQEDLEIVERPAEGIQAVEVETLPIIVYLDTHISRELRQEGLAREIVRRIQAMRKELNLDYAQKIKTYYQGDEEIKDAIEAFKDYIMRETQSVELKEGKVEGYRKTWDIENKKVEITIIP